MTKHYSEFLRVCFVIAVGLVTGIAAQGTGVAAGSKQFSDFPAMETHEGAVAQIDAKSAPEQWSAVLPQIIGIITEDMAKGPNFAGAYYLAGVPCGSGCEAIFVIDLRNGRVHGPESASNGVLFQKDSRLVIVKEDRFHGLPRNYMVFENGKFREIE